MSTQQTIKILITLLLFLLIVPFTSVIVNASVVVFSGYVKDAKTGRPISNADVHVRWNQSTAGDPIPEFDGTTDNYGAYSIEVESWDHDYLILVNADGFESSSHYVPYMPGQHDFYLKSHDSGFLVKTPYTGLVHYALNADPNKPFFYRTDPYAPIMNSEVLYRYDELPCCQEGNYNKIILLLGDILGISNPLQHVQEILNSTQVTEDPVQIWNKCRIAYDWYKSNIDENCPGDFPLNIEEIAEQWEAHGCIPWSPVGGCGTKATVFAVLIYNLGVPKEKVAIVQLQTQFGHHVVAIVYVKNRWVYFDLTGLTPTAPPLPVYSHFNSRLTCSYGYCFPDDYPHPWLIFKNPNADIPVPITISRSIYWALNIFRLFLISSG